MSDYIPKQDGSLITWAANFSKKFALYAKALGFSDNEVADVQDACADVPNRINKSVQAQADAKKAAEEKMKFLLDDTKLFRTVAQRSKKAEGYTEDMGKDMEIIGADTPFDPNTYKPNLSAIVFPGRVTVKFSKNGAQGVNIYSKLKEDANWVKLAFDSFSPYEDNRPLHVAGTAEVRQYMAIGVVHDHEIGQASDIIEVTFGG